MKSTLKICLGAIILLWLSAVSARAQGTAFSYQGHLSETGAAAAGPHDFVFTLFTAATAGSQVGTAQHLNNVAVANGLFGVTLDFGAAAFNGAALWLDISVRPSGSGSFSTLSPRQELTPVPYAVHAQTAGALSSGAIAASQLNTVGTAPAAGQFLSYDGSNLHWSDPGVATGGVFSKNGSDAYYTAGSVGLGTNHPTAGVRLEVSGNVRITPSGGVGFLQIGTPNGETGISFQAQNRADIRYNGSLLQLVAGTVGPPSKDNGITINPAGDVGIGRNILFGQQPRQMLNLFGSGFGIGIQTADLYFRSGAGFAWHLGGQHGDATYDPGPGGKTLMTLDDKGLKFGARGGQHISIWGDPASARSFGFGIQEATLYSRCGNGGGDGFVWYKGGVHNDGYHDAGGGQFLMSLDASGLSVSTLTIRGGADLAEPFEVSGRGIAKGSVLVIDPDHPGKLKLSDQAYDQRVAGVMSGANGVNPGISLHQEGVLEGGQNVALSGRVYVLADAANGAIKPGDLLTTSETPGHAMRVADHGKAQGAILGKAMSSLQAGRGLVLVLVTLQ